MLTLSYVNVNFVEWRETDCLKWGPTQTLNMDTVLLEEDKDSSQSQ